MLELQRGMVMNAGGLVKTPDDVRHMAGTRVNVIVAGSFTVPEKPGNPEPRIHIYGNGNSGNSVGLKNGGIEMLDKELPAMVATAHAVGKSLILNIAGETPEEFARLAEVGSRHGVDGIELNLSCPNRLDEGRRVALDIISDDPVRSGAVVEAVMRAAPNIFIAVKLGPILQRSLLKCQADMCAAIGVNAVSGPNTIPGCYDFDEMGRPVIGAGFFGGAGVQLFTLALGQTKRLRDMLPPEILIIGMGGIRNGADARKFLDVGATAVAVHSAARHPTPPYDINPEFFNQLVAQLKYYLAAKV